MFYRTFSAHAYPELLSRGVVLASLALAPGYLLPSPLASRGFSRYAPTELLPPRRYNYLFSRYAPRKFSRYTATKYQRVGR
jgi:hypothetical protein